MPKITLEVLLNPTLDVGKINTLLAALKKSLGSAGGGIELLDEKALKEFQTELSGAETEAKSLGKSLGEVGQKVEQVSQKGGGLGKAFNFNQMAQAAHTVSDALSEVVNVGAEFESNLAAVSAVTGAQGAQLEALGNSARQLAKEFGGSASDQLKSFQGILSKLGPAVADSPQALSTLAKNVNVLSAASGDDAATSMNALVNTMLQMGLVTGDANVDAANSTRVINALAASAQVGAAEIPQVAESMLQCGVAAKGANLSLEATNAAIQVLAIGGKTGSEAGIALRNVLGLLQNASGTAEQTMSKLGTSSKELGQLLTTQGLDAALAKVKAGMNNLATDAERNSALMQIFGTETAGAAGILLDNADKMKEFADGITAGEAGIGSAFQQAAIRMNTASTSISRAKAFIEDQMIGLFQTIGSGFSSVVGSAAQIAPTITSLAGLKEILPTDMIAKFGGSLKDLVLPALVKLGIVRATGVAATAAETTATVANTAAKGAEAVVTEGATVAQYALNTAMLANPIFLIIAGITAAVGAFLIFRKSTKDMGDAIDDVNSAMETFNKANDEATAVKKQSDDLRSLADQYDKLKTATDPEGQKKFQEVAAQLAQQLPQTADSVDKLDASGRKVGETYTVSTDAVREFANEQQKISEEAKADALAALDDQAQGLADSYHEASSKLQEMRAERDALEKDVKDGKGDNASTENLGFSLDTVKDDLKEVRQDLVKQREELSKGEATAKQVVSQYAKMNLSAADIAKRTGLTVDEVKKLYPPLNQSADAAAKAAGSTQGLAGSAERAKASAESLAEAYKKVREAADKAYNDTFGAARQLQQEQLSSQRELASLNKLDLAQLTVDQQKRKAFLEQRLKDLPLEIKAEIDAAKQALKDKKALDQADTRLKLSVGEIQLNTTDLREQAAQIRREIGDILFDVSSASSADLVKVAKDKIDLDLKNNLATIDTQIKAVRKQIADVQSAGDPSKQIVGGDQLIEALIAKKSALEKQAVVDKVQAEKDAADKQLKVFQDLLTKENALRDQGLATWIETLQREQDAITGDSDEALSARLSKRLQILNTQQAVELEGVVTGNKEYLLKYGELQIALQELGKATTDDQRKQILGRVTLLQKELADRRVEIIKTDGQALAIQQKYDADRQKSEEEILDARFQRRSKELETQFKKEEQDLQDSLNRQAEIASQAGDFVKDFSSNLVQRQNDIELAKLQAQFDSKLISEKNFNQQKEALAQDSAQKLEAIQARQAGRQLEIERQKELASLALQRSQLERKKKEAEDAGKVDQVNEIGAQLDALATQIDDKGSILTELGTNLQSNMTGIFLNLVAADGDAVKNQFRKVFSVIAGALTRLASAKVSEVILSTIGPTGIPGLIGAVALKPIVEELVDGLMNLGTSALLSFTTGGRVDQPTVAVVGDGAKLGGRNREWIFTDGQLQTVMQMVLERFVAAMGAKLDRMIFLLENLPGRFSVDVDELRIAYDRASEELNRRKIGGKTVVFGS